MKDREQSLGNSNSAEKKGGLRAPLRTALLLGTLGTVLALARDGNTVQATDNSVDPQTRNTLSLENPPNQPEYSQLVQSGTRVQGYIEVPDGQQMEEADRQAFDDILKGVQQWFYDNIGATFEIGGDVRFVTRPPDVQYPANLPDFFEGQRVDPRIGAFVFSSGRGAACDREINRYTFLIVSLAGWRDQNRNTPVPIPADDLRTAGPCLGNDGLGAAYLGEDWLDREPRDQAVLGVVLDIAIANALGDTNAPTLDQFDASPGFTPEQAQILRNSPLFTRVNPNFQQPQEPAAPSGESIHLDGIWNFVANTAQGCQSPENVFQSLIDQGMPFTAWVFNPASGQWEGFDSQFPQVSDLKQICHLQVVAVRPKDQVDWQPNVRTLRDGSRDYGNGIIGPSLADQERS